MIINEKQIMQLILYVTDYSRTLHDMKIMNGIGLNENGIKTMDAAVALVNQIYNQQSEELKVIE